MLTDAYKDAIWIADKNRRTPLHFALSNAKREACPGAVRHLLSLNPNIVNSIDGGPLPLRVLAEYANTLRNEGTIEDKANVEKCLEPLLNAKPSPTADFFTALQVLPDWLSEKAVVVSSVQVLLNYKISQRFPTMILMCDFYFLVMVIFSYSFLVIKSIDDGKIEFRKLVPLYIGVGYFFFREVIEILSLLSLKSFHIWLYKPSTWLNIAFMSLVLFWTIVMQIGAVDRDQFRTGTALSVIVLWLKLLAFLRNFSIDFAVFVDGLFYVVKRLAAFLTVLGVILFAFAQMFNTIFQQYCYENPQNVTLAWCKRPERLYCSLWSSFLSVYTMLLGEVDEMDFGAEVDEVDFGNYFVATVLFSIFMFVVVILLASVLIGIVTDSYKVIQDQRAAIVFWTNRLAFVAEMDAIANGPWKHRMRKAMCFSRGAEPEISSVGSEFGKEFWKRLMDLFDDDVYDNVTSSEFWSVTLGRCVASIIIPFWFLLGLITAGWLWPPQIRQAIFNTAVSKYSSVSEKEDELRKTQVALLQKGVGELVEGMEEELNVVRTQLVQMRSQIGDLKAETASEMKQIKRIVAMLFEQQGMPS